ncbi:MAG: peptidoglycan editing factor PgeF [Deltaproteobacteria bacterium]|nr:peptidoglycan editing factor PgeF [Deltaproteobacteria bacterium]
MKSLTISHGFGTRGEEPVTKIHTAVQVHGSEILFLDETNQNAQGDSDILMTNQKGLAVGVKTADCVPILLADPQEGIVAAVHAGWKGTLAGAVQKAVHEMVHRGAKREKLIAAIGPCISGRCYEVERDVAQPFESQISFSKKILSRKSETKWLLDLSLANQLQLLETGIKESHIDRLPYCTHCHPDLFCSYRRDGKEAGRMISFISLDFK